MNAADCLYCIDGVALGASPLLGPCFQICPACRPVCPCCEGQGRYPTWTQDLGEFLVFFNSRGLRPMLCHSCGGLVGADPIEQENPS